MKKLVLETTAPFQGLPELVAYDEGLFAKEGLDDRMGRPRQTASRRRSRPTSPARRASIRSPATASCSSRARPTCTTPANGATTAACRTPASGSRQLGRRAIVTYCGASWCAPDSPVYTPQQLANRTVGVPFYFGTHYIALHMLEGFLPREQIKLCRAPNGSRYRLDALMNGEIEATTLTEPHVTLAEKKGCRIICSAFFHGTEVASDRVDAETYARLQPRGARGGAAHQRQQDGLHALLHRLSRQEGPGDRARSRSRTCARAGSWSCDPAPIPLDEMQRTYDWLKSWGMLEETASPLQLVNAEVQSTPTRRRSRLLSTVILRWPRSGASKDRDGPGRRPSRRSLRSHLRVTRTDVRIFHAQRHTPTKSPS